MKKMLLMFFIAGTFVLNLIAQGSETISYQGYLTEDGKEINGMHALTFRIYTEKGIEPVWKETHKEVEIVDGLFNVYLGSIEKLDITFMQEYFFTVQLDENDEFSKIPFSSVATSFYSKKSGMALDVADGAVGTGAIQNGAVTSEKLAEGAINSGVISNEAGVAYEKSDPLNAYRPIEQGINAIDSITIECPDGGYVYVTALLTAAISHTAEIEDEAYFQIMETAGNINYQETGFGIVRVPANLPTETSVSKNYAYPVHLSRVIPIKSAGKYTFYLNSHIQAGWDKMDSYINAQLTAIYFPTAYGGVNTLMFSSPSTLVPAGQ